MPAAYHNMLATNFKIISKEELTIQRECYRLRLQSLTADLEQALQLIQEQDNSYKRPAPSSQEEQDLLRQTMLLITPDEMSDLTTLKPWFSSSNEKGSDPAQIRAFDAITWALNKKIEALRNTTKPDIEMSEVKTQPASEVNYSDNDRIAERIANELIKLNSASEKTYQLNVIVMKLDKLVQAYHTRLEKEILSGLKEENKDLPLAGSIIRLKDSEEYKKWLAKNPYLADGIEKYQFTNNLKTILNTENDPRTKLKAFAAGFVNGEKTIRKFRHNNEFSRFCKSALKTLAVVGMSISLVATAVLDIVAFLGGNSPDNSITGGVINQIRETVTSMTHSKGGLFANSAEELINNEKEIAENISLPENDKVKANKGEK